MSEYLQALTDDQLDIIVQLVELEKGRRKEKEWNELVAHVAASAPPLPKDIEEKLASDEIQKITAKRLRLGIQKGQCTYCGGPLPYGEEIGMCRPCAVATWGDR
ncbi:MAG: hypothetical protein ACXAC5_03320 [Promethearchaeota archaeon]